MMKHVACVGDHQWARTAYIRAASEISGQWKSVTSPGSLMAQCWTRDKDDVFWFLHWSDLVPAAITENYQCINMHAAPLPYGRGGGPLENLILRDHTETVITAHRMTQDLDAGPVYAMAGAWSTIEAYRALGLIDPDWPPRERFIETGVISLKGHKERDILPRFVEPVVALMRFIVEQEPAPIPQCGEVVIFKRPFSAEEYREFWRVKE